MTERHGTNKYTEPAAQGMKKRVEDDRRRKKERKKSRFGATLLKGGRAQL